MARSKRLLHLLNLPVLGAFLFTSLFPPLIIAQLQDSTNITLIETDYNLALQDVEKKADDAFTLPEFLRDVVSKEGYRTNSTQQEDRSLNAFIKGWRWNSDDDKNNQNWEPQSLTTYEDSLPIRGTTELKDAAYQNVMIVTWRDTASDDNKGVKVTFVVNGTLGDGNDKRYMHVLLVDGPKADGDDITFTTLRDAEGGGVVWHGNWLYVTDKAKGIRMFDINRIWRLKKEAASGIKYILPQAREYSPNLPSAYSNFNWFFASMERNSTPPALLVGDYNEVEVRTSIFKFQFDGNTQQLSTTLKNNRRIATANWAYKIDIERVRGMVFANGYYFIGRTPPAEVGSSKPDRNRRGSLFVWRPRTQVSEQFDTLPRAQGGFAYIANGDELWTLGAASGARYVAALKATNLMGNSNEKPISESPTPTSNPDDPPASSTETNDTSTTPTHTDTSTKDSPNKGTIAGAVVGSIAGMAAIMGLVIFLFRKRRSSRTLDTSMQPEGGWSPPGDQAPGDYYVAGGGKPPSLTSPIGGEIPMVKPELDADSTQVHYTGASVPKELGTWEEERQKAGRAPVRKPVPAKLPDYYESHRGSLPPVEMPT